MSQWREQLERWCVEAAQIRHPWPHGKRLDGTTIRVYCAPYDPGRAVAYVVGYYLAATGAAHGAVCERIDSMLGDRLDWLRTSPTVVVLRDGREILRLELDSGDWTVERVLDALSPERLDTAEGALRAAQHESDAQRAKHREERASRRAELVAGIAALERDGMGLSADARGPVALVLRELVRRLDDEDRREGE